MVLSIEGFSRKEVGKVSKASIMPRKVLLNYKGVLVAEVHKVFGQEPVVLIVSDADPVAKAHSIVREVFRDKSFLMNRRVNSDRVFQDGLFNLVVLEQLLYELEQAHTVRLDGENFLGKRFSNKTAWLAVLTSGGITSTGGRGREAHTGVFHIEGVSSREEAENQIAMLVAQNHFGSDINAVQVRNPLKSTPSVADLSKSLSVSDVVSYYKNWQYWGQKVLK